MANLKATTIENSFVLPKGTSAQRIASDDGAIRFNTDLKIVEHYDSEYSNWLPIAYIPPIISGGTVINVTIGNSTYRIHTFTTTGTTDITVTRGGEVEYLIVGGGGAGGASRSGLGGGGGGGGGGVLMGKYDLQAGTYQVVVGQGGYKATANTNDESSNGSPSAFAGITALGGGAGGNGGAGTDGKDGASGGGGGYRGYTVQPNYGLGTLGQGHRGSGVVQGSASGGGGGGAAGPGYPNREDGGPGNGGAGGVGGPGILSNITGNDVVYGRGGQGGSSGEAASPNTGKGGRGTYAASNNHAAGDDGIVVIRYRIG